MLPASALTRTVADAASIRTDANTVADAASIRTDASTVADAASIRTDASSVGNDWTYPKQIEKSMICFHGATPFRSTRIEDPRFADPFLPTPIPGHVPSC